jgi:hypothetical protein
VDIVESAKNRIATIKRIVDVNENWGVLNQSWFMRFSKCYIVSP